MTSALNFVKGFLVLLLLVVCGPLMAQEQDGPVATAKGARTDGDAAKAQFILDISQPVGFSVFALDEPYRLVIDLPDMTFEMEQGMGIVERAMVRNFRFGRFGHAGSRVVLDLAGPTKVERAYILPAVDNNPARLVINMEAVDEKEFAEQALRDVIRIGADGKPQEDLLPLEPEENLIEEDKEDRRPLIVLDPGHGGIDTGAVSSGGVHESAIVLSFAMSLRKALEKDGRFRILMTRDSDRFISLSKRVAFAQQHKANLFLSIHADIVREHYVRGATVYTLSDKASDAVAHKLAQQENRSDLIAGLEIDESDDVVADILIDLTRRETANYSALYSRTLVGALKSSIRLSKTPERSAGFRVLKAPDIPSVLLELGYLSNKEDREDLLSKAWREKAIKSILKSINSFFDRRSVQSSALFVSGQG
ncbi:N-acetylmuramoyl-L-alanine amidase [uncultured Cohaesibacter sp.]|uniref:N-acetylmuramoyl-L-alanine amidase n=1 Tax=uncultured Cohaesibacter sp. TaxID=1002546 RepID=UPI0029C61A89|nr:N-acetylmuramoyl-L-alanine amidase [uncultured Cohaesibacter sp.]